MSDIHLNLTPEDGVLVAGALMAQVGWLRASGQEDAADRLSRIAHACTERTQNALTYSVYRAMMMESPKAIVMPQERPTPGPEVTS